MLVRNSIVEIISPVSDRGVSAAHVLTRSLRLLLRKPREAQYIVVKLECGLRVRGHKAVIAHIHILFGRVVHAVAQLAPSRRLHLEQGR